MIMDVGEEEATNGVGGEKHVIMVDRSCVYTTMRMREGERERERDGGVVVRVEGDDGLHTSGIYTEK
jgi:hypothetical protein